MYSDDRAGYFAQARSTVAWCLYPLQRVIAFPQDIGDLFEHFQTREALLAENRELKHYNIEMAANLSRLESLEAETNRIRELLSAATTLGQKVRITEILSIAQDPYKQQIVINKGAEDGVYRGQALVDAHGVMGQIVEVAPKTSTALLITDANHGIPVELVRTQLQTIALGRGDGQSLSLPFLSGNADIKVGDQIVTSGLGGRFPSGYPVGEIYELHHSPGEHFAEALAYPTAKINQGRQALLIWGEHPEGTLPAPMAPEKPVSAKDQPAAPAKVRKP
jgi:rod shape-determining protein MreC